MTTDELAKQLQPFIDEMQARSFALETILQSIMTRLYSSDENWSGLLDVIEQQSLHTLEKKGNKYSEFASPQVKMFFESLRQWKQHETTPFPGSESAH